MPRYANSIIALCLLMLLWIHPVHAHQGAGGKPVLHVAGWDVYSDPERPDKTIGYQSFEALFGATIEFTPLTNLDAIIEAAESDRHYDVFIISNEGVKILYDMKLVQPLVLSNLPNYDNLHPSLKYSAWCQFDARIYAVPWAWGPTGLLYDADRVPMPTSWNILWSPEFKHRVALWDDFSMIWIAALSLGYENVYNLTKPQLRAVRERLFALNKLVYGYYSGKEDEMDYLRNKDVVLMNSWFDPSALLLKEGRNFKMVIPQEGAVGMFDSYLIGHKTINPNLAYQFINHQISPDTQTQMVRITGLPPANMETLVNLTQQEIEALHLDETDYFNRMILWDVMPRRHLYERLLNEVREDLKKQQRERALEAR